MLNNDLHILIQVLKQADESTQWALATLIDKQGSAYRNEGAMMLVSDAGQFFGVLSGGCLEQDIIRQARRAILSGHIVLQEYDSRDFDEGDVATATGCEGRIIIRIQPLLRADLIALEQAAAVLTQGRTCLLIQNLDKVYAPLQMRVDCQDLTPRHQRALSDNQSISCLQPPKRLLLIGAGHDAIALIQQASLLGWHITVWDDRPSVLTQKSIYGPVEQWLEGDIASLSDKLHLSGVDAVVLKSHNLHKDCCALSQVLEQAPEIAYIGLLGPKARRARTLDLIENKFDEPALSRIYSPAGLHIGGELPESIALSILAQIHQVLFLGK